MSFCFTGGLHYIITHGGIDTEEDYPYVAKDDKCNTKKEGRCVTYRKLCCLRLNVHISAC